mmetsp:Transcript_17443/g.29656  ORF Transcript_17443/g.29656 Transcript_17443/m.29656 type:complete len:89 (-) Transcript_17443:458-724(-)
MYSSSVAERDHTSSNVPRTTIKSQTPSGYVGLAPILCRAQNSSLDGRGANSQHQNKAQTVQAGKLVDGDEPCQVQSKRTESLKSVDQA